MRAIMLCRKALRWPPGMQTLTTSLPRGCIAPGGQGRQGPRRGWHVLSKARVGL
jgi:hypothetical protein